MKYCHVPSDKDTHATKHEEKSNWVHVATFREFCEQSHEDGVHLGQNERGETGLFLKLLLDSGVALSREMSHEVSTKRNEEGPAVKRRKGEAYERK